MRGSLKNVGINTLRTFPGQLAQQIGKADHHLVKGHSVRCTAITVLAAKQFSVVRIKGVTGMFRIIDVEMLFNSVQI